MFKRVLTKSAIISLVALLLISVPVLAYVYRATYTVTDNASGITSDMLPLIALANNEWMADNGFMLSTALDTAVETLGGLTKPHLVTDNMTLTAIPATIGSQTNLYFTTGNTPISAMKIIVGYSANTSVGYIGVVDEDSIELGDNFTIEMSGWVQTTFTDDYSDRNLVYKENAFITYVSGAENITSTIPLTYQVGQSSDDTWRKLNTADWDLTYTEQIAGAASGTHYQIGGGMRFTDIAIPQGATIYDAHLVLTAKTASVTSNVKTRISAEDVDDAVTFANDAGAFDARWATRTTARVDWDDIPSWEVDVEYTSPNIASVIQEIVNRGGWASGQDIVIFWDDFEDRTAHATKQRTAYSYDDTPAKAPKLKIVSTSAASVTATGVSSGEHTVKTTGEILSGFYEDFTTYTETDPNGRLTVIATKATAVNAGRDEDVFLYYDKGANYFDALNEEFEIYIDDASLVNAMGGMAITNTDNKTYKDWAATDLSVLGYAVGSPNVNLKLYRGSGVASATYVATTNTPYFCTLARPAGGDTVTLKIYTDSARTVLVDTLTVSGFGTIKWQYVYGFVNNNSTSVGMDFDGYIQNLDLNERYLAIYIDDVLKDAAILSANVTDNSANWTFMNYNSVPYADNITIITGGNRELFFEPNDMIIGTNLPDRATSVSNNGTIVWGANPYGVSVELGSMVSSTQPSPGVTADAPTQDILPTVETSDWFIEPDVSGTLLTNPFRPFVTMMSDSTTLTEIQAWRFLALALILFLTVLTARGVRGHHGITGIAAGASIGGMVALTIFPLWALVFAIGAVVGGLVAERSPSL